MLRFGFGNRFKPRQFEYIPRYYDPVKEDLKQRLSQYEEKEGAEKDPELLKERIRTGLRMRYRADAQYRSAEEKKSTIRLLVIIVLLFIIAYMILHSDVFFRMVDVFYRDYK